jgi:FKBP-type peptidyl-prolyl cis-trans isomerase FkpA
MPRLTLALAITLALSATTTAAAPTPKPLPAATATSSVAVHYRGTLPDGTEFDSSYSRGVPAEFSLARVIPCWTEGLTGMRAGQKKKLVCTPDKAYGARGVPGVIPPDSTLRFDVHLLKVYD